jgi:hypothetical protein
VTDPVRRLADAVLYEGYILWPYRPSSTKNRKRWTFGGVFPPAHRALHPDDRDEVQAQCLLEADGPSVEATARFLQVVRRQLWRDGEPVEELTAGGERHLSWDEAVEREVAGAIAIPAGEECEPLGDGMLVRSWEPLRGRLELGVEQVGERLHRVTARVRNETPWAGDDREEALRRSFCSTHVLLRSPGTFVSATEAPGCVNEGLWPALVGDGHTMLAAPIILEDFPQIAAESPGDLFDATEIDRLLILNVLSMSEAEQAEMRAADPRAREILERCAALGPEQLLPLHGVFRQGR